MKFINKKKSRDTPGELRSGGTVQFVLNAEDILPGYCSLDKNEQVQQCINIIAELVSSMTIHLMRNGANGDERVKNELSKKIDIAPYSATTRKVFIHRIVTEMLSKGNCVVLPIFGKNEFIENLVPVANHSFINCTPTGYQVMCNGTVFNSDEVLHFTVNPSMNYPYIGRGYAPMLKMTIQNMAQANATKGAFLKSKWKPSLIISANTDAVEMRDKEKRKKLLESYTETTEAGEPWVIPAGEISVEKVAPMTLKDLAIQESLTLDIRTVAAAFGIPPFMVGVGNFNKEEYNNFISTKIMQIAMTIQQELTKKLLYSPDLYFRFNPKSLMQYDLGEQVNFVKEMIGGGIINRNEGRNEIGLSPVDNPEMNEYFVLENYIPVAKLGDQKKLKGGEKDGTQDD